MGRFLIIQFLVVSSLLLGSHFSIAKPKNKSAEKSSVFFVGLKDGAEVTSPFQVQFGLKGKKIKPAGTDVDDAFSGHHHLIIDGQPIAKGAVIGKDSQHVHFGKGETTTQVDLPPGEHTLTLQFADGAHRSFGPELSQTIKVIVK